MDWCWLVAKNGEPRIAGVTVQIDQRSETVTVNEPGSIIVRQACHGMPVIRDASLQGGGRGIGLLDIGIGEELDPCAIVGGEERFNKTGDGMLFEVRREVSHAQGATDDRGDGAGAERRLEDGIAPGERIREMFLAGCRGDCSLCEKQIAEKTRRLRTETDCLPVSVAGSGAEAASL